MKKDLGLSTDKHKILGVIIVSYCSGDVLLECLESLLIDKSMNIKIIVCDNASPDETISHLRLWVQGKYSPEKPTETPYAIKEKITYPIDFAEYPSDRSENLKLSEIATITLLQIDRNLGFAGGVNVGISALRPHPEVDLFWILNPDCIVLPTTAQEYRKHAQSVDDFGLMGGRLIYLEAPHLIQSDGGRINTWTGICRNINQGIHPNAHPSPSTLDFISGANIIASRTFIDQVGLMDETYFLYYEEVDWAARRGDLSILFCPESTVYHHGGTTIGTGSISRLPTAFANYFNYRNRIRYMWRFHRSRTAVAFIFSLLKVIQLLLKSAWSEAYGALTGLLGLSPPRSVSSRINKESAELAFGRKMRSR